MWLSSTVSLSRCLTVGRFVLTLLPACWGSWEHVEVMILSCSRSDVIVCRVSQSQATDTLSAIKWYWVTSQVIILRLPPQIFYWISVVVMKWGRVYLCIWRNAGNGCWLVGYYRTDLLWSNSATTTNLKYDLDLPPLPIRVLKQLHTDFQVEIIETIHVHVL